MNNEDVARAVLRALGIRNPSPSLIENWIRANIAVEDEESAQTASFPAPRPAPTPAQPKPEDFQPKRPAGYSKSNLEPVLRAKSTIERPRGARKPGRPRVIASWFPAVARTMADGTTLKEALKLHGIILDKKQVRALYRSEEFRWMYQEARAQHQKDFYQKRRTREELFRRTL